MAEKESRTTKMPAGLPFGQTKWPAAGAMPVPFHVTFSHPDYTVGSGFAPDLPQKGARGLGHTVLTAGQESGATLPHHSPKVSYAVFSSG